MFYNFSARTKFIIILFIEKLLFIYFVFSPYNLIFFLNLNKIFKTRKEKETLESFLKNQGIIKILRKMK